MKGLLLFRLFLREIRKQRKRVFLTILAIAWGTITIVLLLAFGEGLRRQLMKATHGLGEDIIMIGGGTTNIPYQGLPKGRRILLIEEDIKVIKEKISEIDMISPENYRWDITYSYKEKVALSRVAGVYPSFKNMRTHYPEMGGRFINQLDLKFKRRVVFLGDKLKEELFGKDKAVGKTIFIENIPFKVIGVLKKKIQMSAYGGPDGEKGTIPFSTYQAMYGEKYLNQIIYRPEDVTQAKQIEKKVYQVLGAKHRFDPEDKQALWSWDIIENEKIMKNILLGIQIFLGIIGALSLIVAGVGVANIMYVVVRRRTREIGIKMSLGANRRYIMTQFLLEALIIAFTGGVIGMIISFFVVEALQAIPIKSEGLQFLGKPIISFEVALITALVLGTIGLLSGYFPARRAANLNPVDSLKYE